MKIKYKGLAAMLLAASVLFMTLLSGTSCTGGAHSSKARFSVVTTIFPEYDWVRNILGEKSSEVSLTMLLDTGVDLHSFQPTAEDIIRISSCDVFIYVGGESDKWVADALKEATNKDMVVINLLTLLGDRARMEETVEGMEEEAEEEEEEAYDEHVWLSLKNADFLVSEIAKKLGEADPENAALYLENAKNYRKKCNALDRKYTYAVQSSARSTVLFGDRFPFLYLAKDYGLTYYAAFSGCSAESEASFETVAFLAEITKKLDLPAVLCCEGTAHALAETVAETAGNGAKVLAVDSMQSVTEKDVEAGASYLDIMEKNLSVFTEALQ